MIEMTDNEFDKFSVYIKKELGINMGKEKKMLVFTRLKSILKEHGFTNFSQYYDYLIKDKTGKALSELTVKITTNHTYFMRETKHFDYFKDVVLPEIYKKHKGKKDLTLWCAASSSGEEPYTLQMIVQDFMENKEAGWNTNMLATDISSKVLDICVKGVYSNESMEVLPKDWKKKYFNKYDDENSIIKDEIKKNLIFRKFNLMDEVYQLKPIIQVIFCRNVIIYFDNNIKEEIIKKLHKVMEPGGYLFIGHSETINQGDLFEYVRPAVYRKI
jgi:chemotaxis protein methyltransferase CheR